MCELLGMSANVPTDLCFSLRGLVVRGGKAGPHRDGWGLVLYEDGGMRAFHDHLPSTSSSIAKLMLNYPIKSNVAISHIRLANSGGVCLKNTHPFTRELWGKEWSFAHNGQLKGVKKMPLGRFKPIGTTDSEHAFCWLLNEMDQKFPDRKTDLQVSNFIYEKSLILAKLGVFNILMTEGSYLYCYCATKLRWITRRAPFGEAALANAAMAIDFSRVTGVNDIVTVISTEELTDNEEWTVMLPQEYIVWKKGDIFSRKIIKQ